MKYIKSNFYGILDDKKDKQNFNIFFYINIMIIIMFYIKGQININFVFIYLLFFGPLYLIISMGNLFFGIDILFKVFYKYNDFKILKKDPFFELNNFKLEDK